MGNATFFLNQTQYDWLAHKLPAPASRTKHVIPNDELLNGILFVLKTGCRWQDIPASICSHDYSSCWRRLRFWQKHRHLTHVWQHVLVLLDHEGQIDLSLGNLDGSLVQSPQYAGVGYDSKAFRRHLRKRGTGTNIPERKTKHRRKRGRKPRMNKVHFKFRAFTERTNAWLKSYRKLRYRYERKRGMFQRYEALRRI